MPCDTYLGTESQQVAQSSFCINGNDITVSQEDHRKMTNDTLSFTLCAGKLNPNETRAY